MTKRAYLPAAILIASAIALSCNNAEQPVIKEEIVAPFDLTSAKKEIEAENRSFMELIAKGDSVGVAHSYTTDAKLMFAGPAVTGRAAIQTVFSGIINSGVTKVELKTNEVFGNTDLLAEDGIVTIYVKDQAVAEEKYIILWKKEDGKWKIFRDIANSNIPHAK